jgi:hypothetical protein
MLAIDGRHALGAVGLVIWQQAIERWTVTTTRRIKSSIADT